MKNINEKLHPYWITGFSDAESSFSIRIFKDETRRIGWGIKPIFAIELHNQDLFLLKRIQNFFGVGNIYKHRSNSVYSVQSFKDLSLKIIPHFDKYSLLTKKDKDFFLFKNIVNLLNKKAHFTLEGFHEILNLRAFMNKGLSAELKNILPSTISSVKFTTNEFKEINPNWLVGFTDGEGCFYIKPTKFGFTVNMSISQHVRDIALLGNIADFLNCGIVEKPCTRSSATFVTYKSKDIYDKIIPFFNNYPLQGTKLQNFKYFCEVTNILKDKSKLTEENLKLIKKIKLKMNKTN